VAKLVIQKRAKKIVNATNNTLEKSRGMVQKVVLKAYYSWQVISESYFYN
jgi:hypothetical protein